MASPLTTMELMTHKLLLAPSTTDKTANQAVQRTSEQQARNAMSENKATGWRKKIHTKPPPLKLGVDGAAGADDSNDRRRHHAWRKTIQVSRPGTPISGPSATDEAEDTQGERASFSTPRRDTRPKLNRYTSLFSGFKDAPKGPNFNEPWSDEQPTYEPYVDPQLAIQSIRSHMINFSMKPIPLEHNNHLFCIFEAYHKLRDEKERLDVALQETQQNLQRAEHQWANEHTLYAEEIRRLELLIAQGTTGVAGVLNARQGTVVDRKRMHRKTTSASKPWILPDLLTQEQLDAEIRSRSQQVLLRRPASPSTKMTAMSRQFAGRAGAELRISTPPSEGRSPTLSRKVQSEMNLTNLHRMRTNTAESVAASNTSGFSAGSGDPLPDETSSQALAEVTVECDAISALRELGALVARRRGLDTGTFVNGVMRLLSEDHAPDGRVRGETLSSLKQNPREMRPSPRKPSVDELTPRQTLRRFQSHPQLTSDQKRRRHFSFEPGEDLIDALTAELTTTDTLSSSRLPPERTSLVSDDLLGPAPRSLSGDFITPCGSPDYDSANVSKIPSPIHAFGNKRRTSVSSLQTVMARPNDGRHNSQSSVVTAYRDSRNNSLRTGSSSRSSLNKNYRRMEVSPASNNHTDSIRVGSSLPGDDSTVTGNTKSMGRVSSPSRSCQATRNAGHFTSENDEADASG